MNVAELTGAEEVVWDLSDLYAGPDDERLEADFGDVRSRTAAFRDRYAEHIADLAPGELAQAVDELERIHAAAYRLYAYAYLLFAENTAEASSGALLQRAQELEAELDTQLLFFRLEWTAVDDQRAKTALGDDALASRRHFLGALRRYRPHLLSEPEEQILSETSLARRASWRRLYDELLSGIRVSLDAGEITLEEALARLREADRDVRRHAAEAISVALEPGLRTRAFVLNTMLLDKATEDRLRHYPHWLAERNLGNETPDEAVQALVEAVQARYDLPQRYYRLKARLLGLDRLAHYDRSAPVTATTTRYGWDDAVALVLDAYAAFSPEAGRIAGDFVQQRWIDAALRPDKGFGAFCMGRVPGAHPYVLMNYTGDRVSVLTLAHELGHGLHGMLAQERGYFDSNAPLTLSETASVFGEALTLRSLLAGEEDDHGRLDLLVERLDEAVGTVFRQIALNRFEDAVHTERRERGELSVDRFSELWSEVQGVMLGDSVDLAGYETWWSYIPHFVEVPGYVYAYAYGFLFSLAIYRRYEREGEALVEPYLELLRAGGSASPPELAAIVGLDLADPGLWADGLDAVEEILDEAEALSLSVSG